MIAQENLLVHMTRDGVTLPVGAALETLTAWIITKAMDAGEPRFSKFIDQIHVSLRNRTAQTVMNLEIYGADDEDGPFDLLQVIPITLREPITPDVPGRRYFKLRFVDEAIRERWQLASFEVTGEVQGEEF